MLKGYKKIGQGAFSKVYRKGDSDTVLIISDDFQKECMALGWFPESDLFPSVERAGIDDDVVNAYYMPYYPKVTAPKRQLNERSYKLYTSLRKLMQSLIGGLTSYEKYGKLYQAFESLSDRYPEESSALCEALEAMANYGQDICFEISPRNIAVDEKGNLILLDCFFVQSQLQEIRTSRRQRR